MCSGGCAKCLGIALIPLAILCVLANILLFFPGGKVAENNDHISDEVFYLGGLLGSGVLMIFPALVFLGMKKNDCCGCCGNESCGKRFAGVVKREETHIIALNYRYAPMLPDLNTFCPIETKVKRTLLTKVKRTLPVKMLGCDHKQMFSSIIFAAIGLAGAAYSFIISAVAINKGPVCYTGNGTWGYPFVSGDYLGDTNLWTKCMPYTSGTSTFNTEIIVTWNLTLFSLLLVMSAVEAVLCAVQVINGLIGTICGDCKCCGCCGNDGPV